MKPFIVFAKAAAIFACVLVSIPKATACGWDVTDNYYLFYAFQGDRSNRTAIQAGLTEWWTNYAGTTITPEALDTLGTANPKVLSRSTNPIIRAAYRKNDKAMQQYLGLLCEYLNIAPNNDDSWYYPDKEELEAQRAGFANIAQRVARIPAGKYAAQYTLLRIRALFQAGMWQDVVKVWQQKGKSLPQSIFKDMAAGFYAGALRKLGSDEEAAEIYATLGDLHSATWCVHDGRNLGTIRRLYRQNPNSAAVRLLVQDFVNNTQETLDNINCEGCRLGHNGYISKVYTDEVKQFAVFAQEASANPAVEDPCMWLTAAAWSSYLNGEQDLGRTLIDRAMDARGSDFSRNDARIIRIVIYSGTTNDDVAFDKFVLPELKWLNTQIKYTENEGYNFPYLAAQRIYLRHLVPYYRAHNRETDALLCLAEAEHYGSHVYYEELQPKQVEFGWDYTSSLLELNAAQLQEVYNNIYNNPKNDLQQWLVDELRPSLKQRDLYYDLIGTRLMKEGSFKEALPWLEKVSLEYLSSQAISYYMARRDYTVERWMGPRQTLREVRDGFGGEVLTNLSSNQRLAFCRDILSAEQAVKTAKTNSDKANAHYRLATMLYQGSLQGDCWYLTEYGRSIDPECVHLDSLAYNHLDEASKLAASLKSKDMLTKALFAKAYLNLDAQGWNSYSFYSYKFDWSSERYMLEFYPDNSHQQSRDFVALSEHVKSLPANQRPRYLTQCDVLMTWMKRKP